MSKKIVSFKLNGRDIDVLVPPLTTLQTLLRSDLNYTATKSGCKQGSCGSCTVLVNGEPVMSCILPVENVQGQEILTLEGLTTPTKFLRNICRAVWFLYTRDDHGL
jgi:carbon-monoxide dehydrogenase small subunit